MTPCIRIAVLVSTLFGIGNIPAKAGYVFRETFDFGFINFTAGNPYWLDHSGNDGFVTQTTARGPGLGANISPEDTGANMPDDAFLWTSGDHAAVRLTLGHDEPGDAGNGLDKPDTAVDAPESPTTTLILVGCAACAAGLHRRKR